MNERIIFCNSVIGHACQNIVNPRGESAWDNKRTMNNFQSLIKRDDGDRTFSFSENCEGRNFLIV